MRTETPPMVKRADYRPYPFKIDQVRLRFDLSPDKTRVVSNLSGERISGEHSPMQLHGEALKLVRVVLNGETLSDTQYELTPEGLSVPMKAGAFELEIETEIAPGSNTELSGLYMSGGRFCTQCEAEGFRRITYYPDRPDVLARFHVHMEADASYPFLLSNGNPGKTGKLENGRHFAEWDDPHPKPAYLFALVAGDFDVHRDSFTTRSNKDTPLAIFVDKGDADRAAYAMDSLKRSMRWDEDVFGREYDLDVFNIVAVRDFNFGAMENKGLNIFNSAYVLADGETATDADFEAIESIVGHEYFHNWTGNRITCRDWFQLCLKEGLTVYRDQEFSADMRSAAVTRIKDVIRLRARQFPEDAGPLAHAVRPDQYARIDNLYTATVYEKGAEIIRMLRAIIGDTAFFAGLNRYFDQHDGSAATIEDFLDAFRPSTDFDLDHFALWYSQPGTPTIEAKGEYEAISKTYRLTLKQTTPPTPNQSEKAPFILPIRTALFSSNGQQLSAELNGKSGEDHLLILDTAEQEFVFEKVASAPIHSLNRGFSSAIKLDDGLNDATRSVLAASETDTFAQWESLQTLARSIMIDRTIGADKEGTGRVAAFVDAVDAAVKSAAKDPAYAALLLRLPSVGEMMLDMKEADPQALNVQRSKVKTALAKRMQGYLETLADQPSSDEFDPSAEAAGKRALKSVALDLLSALGDSQVDRIFDVFETASTMTESLAALSALGAIDDESFDEALDVFEGLWASAPLIMDKWFSVQATAVRSDTHDRIAKLATRKDFNLKNPNRVRALAAAFAMNNPVCFHDKSGAGYKFLADTILKVDPLNGALSARLATAFESWRKFSPDHREHAEAELKRLDASSLSKNARDIVNRALAT